MTGRASACADYDRTVSGGIFLLNGEQLVEMRERAYDSEDLLQALLAKYPNLLAGDRLAVVDR